MHIGRFEEARRAHEHAVRSNPANPSRNREWLLLYTGQFVEAEAAADAWLRDAPSNWSAQWYGPQPALMLGHLDVAERHLAQSQGKNATEPLLVSLQHSLEADEKRFSGVLPLRLRQMSLGNVEVSEHQCRLRSIPLGAPVGWRVTKPRVGSGLRLDELS